MENGKDNGAIALRSVDRDDYSEPSARKMEAKMVRHNVITRDGGSEGVTPSREVSESIGAVGAAIARSLPTAACLKRSSQDAAPGERPDSKGWPGLRRITTLARRQFRPT